MIIGDMFSCQIHQGKEIDGMICMYVVHVSCIGECAYPLLGLVSCISHGLFGTKRFTCLLRRMGLKNLHCSSPELLTRLGILGSIEGDQVRFRPASRSSAVALPIQTHNPG